MISEEALLWHLKWKDLEQAKSIACTKETAAEVTLFLRKKRDLEKCDSGGDDCCHLFLLNGDEENSRVEESDQPHSKPWMETRYDNEVSEVI